ncbi:MAG: hypothetical protein ACHQRJ_18880, partial [Alphaproteobacteria bacterium]
MSEAKPIGGATSSGQGPKPGAIPSPLPSPPQGLWDSHIVNSFCFSGNSNPAVDKQQIRHARESGHPERQNPAISANG